MAASTDAVLTNAALTEDWLALMAGSSRLHWAWFTGDRLNHSWDTPHLEAEAIARLESHSLEGDQLDFKTIWPLLPAQFPPLPPHLPLWIASVMPAQTQFWQAYSEAHFIQLDQIPLQGRYSTLGIDRALALWGALNSLSAPVLVIDAGTALTLTGADAEFRLVGGAILPGVQLQLRSLHEHTAALPALSAFELAVPPLRWASSTSAAIQSGVLYGLLAGVQDFIQDWLQQFPGSAIALTGGDSGLLFPVLTQKNRNRITLDPALIFWGIWAVKENS